MKPRLSWISVVLLGGLLIALGMATRSAQAQPSALPPQERLGKLLFFDNNLSLNNNQSCAACHGPKVGYTGPDQAINKHGAVYEGSIPGAFGDRKPPSAAYAGDSPILYFDGEGWVGGMFWDGRATGWSMGDPLAEQAKGPFLNPKEQAIPDAKTLCEKVKASNYSSLYEKVWGSLSCTDAAAVETAYDHIAISIAAYERSQEVSPFTSRFDAFWDKAKKKGLDVTQINMGNWEKYKKLGLDNDQLRGLAVFNGKAQCSACHTLDEGTAGYPLFTDFTYDNLGIPKNPENPATIANPGWADPGLGGFLMSTPDYADMAGTEMGKFKVPSLRDVDLRPYPKFVKTFGHNGYFKSLEEIVHFYNTRDVEPWPAPEVMENMNTEELGNLGLNKTQERWIVEFLKTLSDGYAP